MSPVGPIIHIVDDDKSYRTAVERLMEASGFRVVSYESGEEMLTRLPSSEPGCILLDLQMPGLSGLELQKSALGDRAAPAYRFPHRPWRYRIYRSSDKGRRR
jgi:FixJ family two-component response regulator